MSVRTLPYYRLFFASFIWLLGVVAAQSIRGVSPYPFNYMIPRTLILLLIPVFFLLFFKLRKKVSHLEKNEWFLYFVSFSLSWSLAWLFRNTEFGLLGIEADATHYITFINQYKYNFKFVDPFYSGLAPSYPPVLFFYILGQIAALLNLAPYSMLKWVFIFSSFWLPIIIFRLWKSLVGSTYALLIVLVCLTEVFTDEFLFRNFVAWSSLLLFPWWFKYICGFSNKKKMLGFYLCGGIIGALIFQFYYTFFLIFVLAFFIDISFEFKKNDWLKSLVLFRSPFFVFVSAAFFSSYFWLPQIIDIIHYPTKQLSSRAFGQEYVSLPGFISSGLTFKSIMEFVGLIGLFIYSDRSNYLKKLKYIFIAIVVWHILGHLLMFLDKPIGHIRSNHLLDPLLLISFVFSLKYMLGSNISHYFMEKKHQLIFVFGTLILIYSTTQLIDRVLSHKDAFSGFTPNKEIKEIKKNKLFFKEIHGKTILNNTDFMGIDLPVFVFINSSPYEANMSSQFDSRIKFLKVLFNQNSSRLVNWMLNFNRFNQVNYVQLTGTYLNVGIDQYPNGKINIKLPFNPHVFIGNDYFIPHGKHWNLYKVKVVDIETIQGFTDEEKKMAWVFATDKVRKSLEGKNPGLFQTIINHKLLSQKSIASTITDLDSWLIEYYGVLGIPFVQNQFETNIYYAAQLRSAINADWLSSGEAVATEKKQNSGMLTFGPNRTIGNGKYRLILSYRAVCSNSCSEFEFVLFEPNSRNTSKVLKNVILLNTSNNSALITKEFEVSNHPEGTQFEFLTHFKGEGTLAIKSFQLESIK